MSLSGFLTYSASFTLLCLAQSSSIPAVGLSGVQSRFSGLVNEADSLHAETGNLFASTALLRAALELCPDCKAAINPGHLSEKVFVFDEYADRKLLTDSILPALSHYRPKRILWVGVQAYTLRGLYQLKKLNATITTIEPDISQAAFGADYHHIVAPLGNLLEHVPHNYFDVIFINGVIGWGIDGPDATEAAVQLMYRALQTNGLVIVGWNQGMGTCCDFDPWFHHRRLGELQPKLEVPDSETHHMFEFLRRNDRANHLLPPL